MSSWLPAPPPGSFKVDSIGDPAFTVDTSGIITGWNGAARRFFGKRAADVVGLPCPAVMRACLPTGESVCSAECPLIQGAGVEPGPPAVELMVRTVHRGARMRRAVVQHIPFSDTIGRAKGLLHIVVPAGEAAERSRQQVKQTSPYDEPGAVPGWYLG